jgi:hypothetical protein
MNFAFFFPDVVSPVRLLLDFVCFNSHSNNKGTVVPRMFNKRHRRRKVSIEVHRIEYLSRKKKKKQNVRSPAVHAHDLPTNNDNNSNHTDYYEKCIVRVMDAKSKEEHKAAKQDAKHRRQVRDQQNRGIFLGPEINTAHGPDDGMIYDHNEDDGSVSVEGVEEHFLDQGAKLAPISSILSRDDIERGWQDKYRFPVEFVTIRGTHKTGVIANVTIGKNINQTREFIFDNLTECEDFCFVLERERSLIDKRKADKLRVTLEHLAGTVPNANRELNLTSTSDKLETFTLLIEIVSAWDIPIGDLLSSDPYVICYLNDHEVHRTKYIAKT